MKHHAWTFISAALFCAFIGWCYMLLGRAKHNDLDARQAEPRLLQPAARVALSPQDPQAEAGVQSSPEFLTGDADSSGEDPGPRSCSEQPGVSTLFQDLDTAFQPTAEGLFAISTELWSQEGFCKLSGERAAALLPVDDTSGMLFPETIQEVVGGFPSLAECEACERSKDVQEAHVAYVLTEVELTELQRVPRARRTPIFERLLDRIRADRDADLQRLYRLCDRVGPYKNWVLVHRLFSEWER